MDREEWKTLIWVGIAFAALIGLWVVYAGVVLLIQILVWVVPKLIMVAIIAFILRYFKVINF